MFRRSASTCLSALIASALVLLSIAIVSPAARADYATGGTGTFPGSIDWFTWGTAGAPIPSAGLTRTNTRMIGGQALTTTCTLSTISGTGGLIAYRPGTWTGDALDNLYNIGGTGTNNGMIAGIANASDGQTVNFTVRCSAALDGADVPLQGLVVADAEASNYFPNNPARNEFVTVTPESNAVWRLLDRGKAGAGCTSDALGVLTGNALLLRPNGTECVAQASGGYGPMAVMFMDGSTGAAVTLKGGGKSAIALGVVLQSDFGDAPASYGAAGSIYDPGWGGGTLAQGTNNLTSTVTTAIPGDSPLRLGELIDPESANQPGAGANLDDTNGRFDDEDSITPPSPVVAWPGMTYRQPTVTCTGDGYVTGWIDWNGDTEFDAATEASTTARCTDGSVGLTWTVPADVKSSASYLRLRIGTTAAASQKPTGLAATRGEVEDYPLEITRGVARLALTKTVDRTTLVAGQTATFTLTARNTGNVTLTNAHIDESSFTGAGGTAALSSLACTPTQPATLAPDATLTCTTSYVVTQADVDQGQIVNTATADATPPTGVDAPPKPTATAALPGTQRPEITLAKEAGAPTGSQAGDTITYSFTVTNSGNVTLSSVGVSDPKVGAVTCQESRLAPQQSTTCTAAPYALTQADVDAGVATNTATATGTSPNGTVVTDDDSTRTPIAPTPAITLDKAAGAPTGGYVGDTISYTFVVTNVGNVTLRSVSVNDPKVGAVTCPATQLAPAESVSCTADPYVLTQADVDAAAVDNKATASGTPPSGQPVTDDDSTHTELPQVPSVTLNKQAGVPTGNAAGDTITYTFVVTNSGNVTLSTVGVSDPKVGTVTCPQTTLAPGASTTCTAAPYPLTQGDVDAGSVTNTATAGGTPPTGPPVTSTDVTTTPIVEGPAIALDKAAGVPSGYKAGDTMGYTFTVTNVGNVTLSAVQVADAKVGAVTCPATTLAPGATTLCTAADYVLTQTDIDSGAVDNTATASGTGPTGEEVDATDSTHTPIPAAPVISLDKQAGAPTGNQVGETITYTFVVANAGNVTLDPVTVSDAKVGTVTCPQGALAPGATTTCTAAPYELTAADVDAGTVNNTATATGTPPTGEDVTSNDSTQTPITSAPAITLDKQAGTPTGTGAGETIAYTFVVTNSGNVTLTDVEVTDPLLGAVTCPVSTLAAGASTTCTAEPYVLTQADLDAGAVDNTATATGTPPTGYGVTDDDSTHTVLPALPSITLDKQAGAPTGSNAGDTITYTFVVTNTGNVTLDPVEVTDAKVGQVTCPQSQLAPGEATACTAAPYALTQTDVNSGAVTNTASATGTPPSGEPVDSTDSTTTPITAGPAIMLDKAAGVPSGFAAGDTIPYTFTVTNVGNVTLTEVTVTDAKVGAVTCPDVVLEPRASTVCTAGAYVLTQAEVDAGQVDNTATASGTPPTGQPVTDDDATTTPIPAAPALALVKKVARTVDVNGNQKTDLGDEFWYEFEVTNTGNVTATDLSVDDPMLTALQITVTCPSVGLAPGQSATCAAESAYVVTQADVDAGKVTNTATATGTPPSGPPTLTPPSTIDTPVESASALTLVKRVVRVEDVNQNRLTDVGDRIWWAFALTNTGTTTLTGVAVNDPMLAAKQIRVVCPTTSLAPGATVTCTATSGYRIARADARAGKVVNVATASATPPSGTPLVTPPSSTTTGVGTLTVNPIVDGGDGGSGGHDGGYSGGGSGLASTGGPTLYAGGLALILIVGGAVLIGASRRRTESRR